MIIESMLQPEERLVAPAASQGRQGRRQWTWRLVAQQASLITPRLYSPLSDSGQAGSVLPNLSEISI